MKTELIKISTDLLLANNLEKIKSNKESILKFIVEVTDDKLKATIQPIIEDEFQKIIEILIADIDANTMQERLQIFHLLTSINSLIN